jgi:hypothetical protein
LDHLGGCGSPLGFVYLVTSTPALRRIWCAARFQPMRWDSIVIGCFNGSCSFLLSGRGRQNLDELIDFAFDRESISHA